LDILKSLLSLNYFNSSANPAISFEARSLAERGNSAYFGVSFFGSVSFPFETVPAA
jgi:hypothetical protein